MEKRNAAGGLMHKSKVLLLAAGITAGSLMAWNAFGGQPLNKPAFAAGTENAVMNTVAVTGTGKVSVAPDIAYVSAGVSVTAKTAKEAQAGAAKKYDAVRKALTGTFGVAEKDLKTTNYSVQPQYRYTDKEGQVLTGYTAVQDIQISYRNIDKTGDLVDGLAAAGANRINNISFGTEKGDAYTQQALQKAVEAAKVKAMTLAQASGRTLGEVVSISENGAQVVQPVIERAQMKMAAASDSSANTVVDAGEVDVTSDITVLFSLK
ncbi:SIMPL domain-containing protein [Paenibacillus humicus]|uniref:SIMPL domain-containing protein n=1 Tax=Paenibacillus humicus TaxID=412861 RepID=UPI0013E3D9D9|nr:SIMPL domain-containing protein [Paenibacillus humicus]